ncbi:hypothetical protein BFF94_036805 [Burkholderia catarinensis]|nr:hypothetical protein BFF94_036805 [Burkholderia catarinensis]
MPYVIETWDKPDSLSLRMKARPDHLELLAENASMLLACGAKLADDGKDLGGGLYVVDTDMRSEAQAFIESDPFFRAGLFDKVQITRWRKAYVAKEGLHNRVNIDEASIQRPVRLPITPDTGRTP